jgi:hypothetical protein
MTKITVHGGDFKAGATQGSGTRFVVINQNNSQETITPAMIQSIEVANEDSVKRIGGTVGWGAVGALALGPVGLLAGLLLGGKKKETTFVAELKDGRKIMATVESPVYIALRAGSL